jgi:hypothetical protein
MNFKLPTSYLTRLWSVKAWQAGLKSRPWLLGRLNRLVFLVVGKTTASYAGGVYVFVCFCGKVTKSQGLRGLQIYLKACSALFQNAVAGRRLYG